jgi:hypothetical protein
MSDFPLLMFLSPEALLFMLGCLGIACWIFFGWIDPISKINDKNNKSKGGAWAQLLILGVGVTVAFIIAYNYTPNKGVPVTVPAPPKTGYAPPPAPSANMGSMTAAPLPNAPPAPAAKPFANA